MVCNYHVCLFGYVISQTDDVMHRFSFLHVREHVRVYLGLLNFSFVKPSTKSSK